MKKVMVIVAMFAFAAVPFVHAGHHDHGPSRDMQNVYGIMGLIDWVYRILGIGVL